MSELRPVDIKDCKYIALPETEDEFDESRIWFRRALQIKAEDFILHADAVSESPKIIWQKSSPIRHLINKVVEMVRKPDDDDMSEIYGWELLSHDYFHNEERSGCTTLCLSKAGDILSIEKTTSHETGRKKTKLYFGTSLYVYDYSSAERNLNAVIGRLNHIYYGNEPIPDHPAVVPIKGGYEA